MAPPSTSRTLAERSSALLQQTARSKSLAEQSAQLLMETAQIFPNKPFSPGVTKVLETVPPREKSDGTDEPRNPGIKHEITKEGGSRTEPGRRKQKNPRKSGGFETSSTWCTSPRDKLGRKELRARPVVHRGVQCNLQTEFLSAMGPPQTPTGAGGVTLSKILLGDPRNNLKGMS